MKTELEILKESYSELLSENERLKRDIERKARKLEALTNPQEQLIAKEAKIVWLYGIVSEKEAVIANQAKKLDGVQDLVEIGKEALNKIAEVAE